MAEDNDPVILANENEVEKTKVSGREPVMKPEKVKSRWRRSSEMECSERKEYSPEKQSQNSVSAEKFNPESNNIEETIPIYEFIKENVYTFKRKLTKKQKEVRRMLCDCSLTEEEKENGIMGCQDECLNRLLMIECGSRCETGDACSNKRFQKRLYAKVEPFKTDKKGWGLRLLEDIPRGTFVIEYVGEVLSRHGFKQRVKEYAREKSNHYYFMALKSDEIIDATKKGNLSRFMNHSCNPNCETQKWTCNGELRIGFFAKTDLKASSELTFDYQFERYGRQAQNCFCGSDSCTGYIGLTNEITVDVNTNKNFTKKKRLEEKKRETFKDLMLEEEIQKLCDNGGLRNKDDVLLLSRLMVRAEDEDFHSRVKLLDVILGTSEVACLRLFLDYHGLSLLWSWMAYLTNPELRAKILEVLTILPVPNKTSLSESKVLSVVEKWASPSVIDDSAGDAEGSTETASDSDLNTEAKKLKTCDTSDSETEKDVSVQCLESSAALPSSEKDKIETICDYTPKHSSETHETNANLCPGISENSVNNLKAPDVIPRSDEESADTPDEESSKFTKNSEVAVMAQNLISLWKHLKEDFRIPRLEQQSDSLTFVPKKNISPGKINCIPTVDSFRQNNSKCHTTKDSYHSGRTRNKECFNDDWKRSHGKNHKRSFNRAILPSKAERRMQFAMQIHLKDEELSRKQNVENHSYNDVDENYLNENCTYNSENVNYSFPAPDMFYSQKPLQSTRPALLPTPGTEPVFARQALPSETTGNVYTPNLVYHQQTQVPFLSVPPPIPQQTHVVHCPNNHVVAAPNFISVPNNSTPIVPAMTNLATDMSTSSSAILHPSLYNAPQNSIYLSTTSQVPPSTVNTPFVPNQTQFLTDQKAIYYMESQYSGPQSTDQQLYTAEVVNDKIESQDTPAKLPVKLPPQWRTATDDDGNMYYYHTQTRQTQWEPPDSNDTEDVDSETPTYDEPKERKHATHSRRSHKKHTKKKSTTTAAADTSGNPVSLEVAKKIRELFRTKMSAFVIQCLNPYRRDDCQIARITNNEDFKHLARKLTHFVMAKELKHCKSVEDLDCNDNVKHKARDYIYKYMAKYGKVYRKEKGEIFGNI
ncbi:histone-lysine N-methyltransferase SETD2-like [Uloborus diversus]|uniref:histone-lysine N-methyltransferase SETD2-like n=1 Tax=Uloborus diversus TaxID=327109 RepID=UPI0024091C3F|nr:histone-lysine N-methyltransferase SETD2-like [Uloborus diversus]